MPTFQSIRAGDRVRYTDAHGATRTGTACPLLLFPAHVVVNAGGRHGRPVVVDHRNYVSHVATRRAYKG